MRAIILAAGMGTRLCELTSNRPKGMVKVLDKPLIEWQIDSLRKAGVEEIIIVSGYKDEMIDFPGTTKIHNPDFASTNMVESLMCARDYFDNDFLISYADIIYDPGLVTALIDSKDDVAVLGDRRWKRLWELRFGSFEEDIESFAAQSDGTITDLGAPVDDSSSITHRYIGLLKFSKKGAKKLIEIYNQKAQCAEEWSQSGKAFLQGYMTDVLSEISQSGQKVGLVEVVNGWMEFDEPSDLNLGQELFDANMMGLVGDFNPEEKGILKGFHNHSFSNFTNEDHEDYLNRIEKYCDAQAVDYELQYSSLAKDIEQVLCSKIPSHPTGLISNNSIDAESLFIDYATQLCADKLQADDLDVFDKIHKRFEVKKHLYAAWPSASSGVGCGGFMQPSLYSAFALCLLLRFLQTGNFNCLNSALKACDWIMNCPVQHSGVKVGGIEILCLKTLNIVLAEQFKGKG